MAKDFGAAERRIGKIFAQGKVFTLNGSTYEILFSGKPTCKSGEPKTDIYCKAICRETNEEIELKISFKKKNADFLENKTSAKRAEQLLGADWSKIIIDATKSISHEFNEKPLIFKKKYGHTDNGAITLGWKFVLLRVKSGDLSGSMNLSTEQIIDVYSGTNISDDKKNAIVNSAVIKNSGIANYILWESDYTDDLQTIVDNLVTVEEYVDQHSEIFFACKALNYRTFRSKYDGNRPLSVYVEWSAANGKLTPRLVFDEPLLRGGDYAADKLLAAMKALGIKTTDDINSANVSDPSVIYE